MNNLAENLDYNYLEKLTQDFEEQETVAFYNRTIWSQQARPTQIEPLGNWPIVPITSG